MVFICSYRNVLQPETGTEAWLRTCFQARKLATAECVDGIQNSRRYSLLS